MGEFGAALRQIHAARPPAPLRRNSRETFVPQWSATIERIQRRWNQEEPGGSVERELAAFWTGGGRDRALVRRAAAWANSPASDRCRWCSATRYPHRQSADRPRGGLRIVDWDATILRPSNAT
jgi:hypothetical protein